MASFRALVLVVDDVNILRMIQRILELEGYRVLTACNGKDVLDRFIDEAPDLVLLDIIMPDMDGYTVCHRVQAPVL